MFTNIFKRFVALLIAVAVIFAGGVGYTARSVLAYNAGIETFVNSLYSDCLGRSADPAGFNDWCNKLATGQITGKQCAYGFFFSPEFINRVFTPAELVDVYYHVFLNRDADPAGKRYWLSRINTDVDFTVADALLFQGFADSTEFAAKCASYGIIAGDHTDTGVDTSNVTITVSDDNSGINMPAASVEALDAYWHGQGYETFYIDLGNGNTVKCYALFYDMSSHYARVNEYRASFGLPAIYNPTDPNDSRVQWARMRAVECAFCFSHKSPYGYITGGYSDDRMPGDHIGGAENIYSGMAYGGNGSQNAFEAWRTSPNHNAAMLDGAPPEISGAVGISSPGMSGTYYSAEEVFRDYPQWRDNPSFHWGAGYVAMTAASCTIRVVAADGLSIVSGGVSANPNYYLGRSFTATNTRAEEFGVPVGSGRSSVQCYWQS